VDRPPLVSIVTPSLNQGRFIEAAIESVLSQDYPRIEYIVMDGGSTDGTLDILARYGQRFTWVSEPDRGQSHAINKGFRRARGDVLAWLNSDDAYLPGAVRSAVEHLVEHADCAMVYGDGYLMDEGGRMTRPFPATEPFDLWKLVYVQDYILQQSAFFRRDAFDAVGYVDESLHWGMDWDLFIKIGKRYRVDYLPKALASLREYGTAKTFAGGTRRLAELVGVMRRHGSRRCPPARVAYAVDTYFRLVFGSLEARVPARSRASYVRLRRILERRVYGRVNRYLHHAQGAYTDGWVGPRAHYLLRRPAGARRLIVRGTRLPLRQGQPAGTLRALVDGVDAGRRPLPAAGEFEVAWPLPEAGADADVVEIDLRSAPAVRPSHVPFRGDRRRLSFQLRAIAIE
jgi:glycosyltransferase involved in cell wall biosynthesis